MTSSTMSVLDRGRALALPAMRTAIARLDPSTRLASEYHLGWCDSDGTPTTGNGGKAFRPALALLSAQAVRASTEVAVPGAVAVELVHNFSLLHDDVIDGDMERRHRKTVWAIWGVPTAILAGDAMLALAHEVVLESPSAHNAEAAVIVARVTRELTRGQTLDVAFESRPTVTLAECIDMAIGKTGSLLAAASSIGAVLAGADTVTVEALHTFGIEFGLAFQLVDDVLGIWGDPAVTGKPVHSDLRSRKKSLPVTWAMAHERFGSDIQDWLCTPGDPDIDSIAAIAGILSDAGARDWALAEAAARMGAAERALDAVDLDPGARSDLMALAKYCVERTS